MKNAPSPAVQEENERREKLVASILHRRARMNAGVQQLAGLLPLLARRGRGLLWLAGSAGLLASLLVRKSPAAALISAHDLSWTGRLARLPFLLGVLRMVLGRAATGRWWALRQP